MTLSEFARICRNDTRLAPLWDDFKLAGLDVLLDRIDLVFYSERSQLEENHVSALKRHQDSLVNRCVQLGVAVPDLSLTCMIKFWLSPV